MRLLTSLVLKTDNIDVIYNYLNKNLEKLSITEINTLTKKVAESGVIDYIKDLPKQLNEVGITGTLIDELALGLIDSIDYPSIRNVRILNYFIKTVNNISDEVVHKIINKIIIYSILKGIDAETVAEAFVFNKDRLTKEEANNLISIIAGKKNVREITILLGYDFITKEQREMLINGLDFTLHYLKESLFSFSEREKAIIDVLNYYYKTINFIVMNKDGEYNNEKDRILESCIDTCMPTLIFKLIVDDKYELEDVYISSMINKLITMNAHGVLIEILAKKITLPTKGNSLSDIDVNNIINCVCKTYCADWIYQLAYHTWDYLTDKQKLSIRRAMFKSNDPDLIAEYVLEIDKEAVSAKFKTIEKFYNYVDDNMNDIIEKQKVKENILNPRSYNF